MSEPFFKAKDFHHPQEGHREHAAAIANAKRDTEIERLQAEIRSLHKDKDVKRMADAESENASLDADNARLRAELEELRREFHKTRPVGAAEIDNIRLREALSDSEYDFQRIHRANWDEYQMRLVARAGAGKARAALEK